jgi:septation ring formation regulator EzrA
VTDIGIHDVMEVTRKSRSLTELADAIDKFKENYQLFANKNSQFLLIDEDLQEAFQKAQRQDNIQRAAVTFSEGIWAALRTVEKKKKSAEGKWTTKLGNVLTKLYPVARLSLGLAANIGDVVFPRWY